MKIKRIIILADIENNGVNSEIFTFRKRVGKLQELRFSSNSNAEISIFDKFKNSVISEKIYTRAQKQKKFSEYKKFNFSSPTIFQVDIEDAILSGIIKIEAGKKAQLIAIEYD